MHTHCRYQTGSSSGWRASCTRFFLGVKRASKALWMSQASTIHDDGFVDDWWLKWVMVSSLARLPITLPEASSTPGLTGWRALDRRLPARFLRTEPNPGVMQWVV